jgi:hypothetical protein
MSRGERTARSEARGRAWPWRTSVSSIGLRCQSPAAALRDRLRRVDAASIAAAGDDASNPVAVLLAGRQRTGRSEVIEDRAAVLAEVDDLVGRYGRKGAGQRIGVALDTTPPPTGEDLALAMRGHVVIRLVLDGMPARGGRRTAAVGAATPCRGVGDRGAGRTLGGRAQSRARPSRSRTPPGPGRR